MQNAVLLRQQRSLAAPAAAARRVRLHIVAAKSDSGSSSSGKGAPARVQYGEDWYAATRQAAKPRRTAREEMEYRREANRLANNGKERKDLYTNNWDGSEYKGSGNNILTWLAVLFVATPVAGLIFAKVTYGVYWG